MRQTSTIKCCSCALDLFEADALGIIWLWCSVSSGCPPTNIGCSSSPNPLLLFQKIINSLISPSSLTKPYCETMCLLYHNWITMPKKWLRLRSTKSHHLGFPHFCLNSCSSQALSSPCPTTTPQPSLSGSSGCSGSGTAQSTTACESSRWLWSKIQVPNWHLENHKKPFQKWRFLRSSRCCLLQKPSWWCWEDSPIWPGGHIAWSVESEIRVAG